MPIWIVVETRKERDERLRLKEEKKERDKEEWRNTMGPIVEKVWEAFIDGCKQRWRKLWGIKQKENV